MQYGMAMMLVFTLQISAAIAGFTLMSKSRYMVTNQLHYMMNDYQYYYRLEVDWIQSKVSFADYLYKHKKFKIKIKFEVQMLWHRWS